MNPELHQRLISALFMFAAVLVLYAAFIVLPSYWHYYLFTLITLCLVTRVGYEWSYLVPALDRHIDHAWWRYVIPLISCGTVVGFLLLYQQRQLDWVAWLDGMLLVLCVLSIIYCSIRFKRMVPANEDSLPLRTRQWDTAILGIAYTSLAGIGLLAFWMLEQNFLFVFLIMLCIIIADSTAYFAGKRWGKRKICPQISPGKTWIGAIAALLSVFCFFTLVSWVSHTGLFSRTFSLWTNMFHVLILFAIVILSMWGDLFISILKRRSGIKDVSNLIPGHGGLLDRVDGMMMVFAFLSPIPLWILIYGG